MSVNTSSRFWFALLVCLLAPVIAHINNVPSRTVVSFAVYAQGPRATLTGTVTDEAGAVIPGVAVTAENTATLVQTRAETNDEGHYTLPFLQPGVYRITAERPGYARVEVQNAELTVSQTAEINLQLKTGQITEQVTVQAQGLILETERSTLGGVIDNERIENLPLLGRNPYSLVALVPGARPSSGLNQLPVDQISTASASINGSRGNQNEYLLDGAPNSVAAQNQPAVYPSADAVQEFKVETNNYSAEYGRAAGGIFNVVTKSGTKDFHGNFYNFLRNDVFDANNFFNNRAGTRKPPFRFNQFGATIGGPLYLPRFGEGGPVFRRGRGQTFFFGAFEGARVRQGVTYLATVPTALQRQGDFSQTFNAQGQLVRIFDPQSTRRNPANTAQFIRDPFPGNRVPLDRINPITLRALQLLPLPNTVGNPVTGLNNYISTAGQRIDKDTFNIRVDHNFSDRQKLFARISYDDTPWIRPDVFGSIASPSFGDQIFKRRNFAVDDVYTFSSTLVGNARYSWSRLSNFRTPRSFGFDIAQLGFPAQLGNQIGLPSIPAFNVNGMGGSYSQQNVGIGALFGLTDLIRFGMDTHSAQGNLTKIINRHTLKAGVDVRVYRFNTRQQADAGNNFTFGPAFTQGPNPASASTSAGYGFASFLLGTGSGEVQVVPALALQQVYYGVFIQDDFKVTSKLTLNLGLRYDYEAPRTDRFNQLSQFDYAATPPLQAPGLNLRGTLEFPGGDGASRYQYNPDRNNFAPRLGFAYQLFERTVVRGGGGLFYAPTTGVGGTAANYGSSGFQATTTLVGSLDGVTPFRTLSNPYPEGIIQPTGSSLGARTLLGQSIQFADRNVDTPYAGQWNLNVQQALPGDVLFEVGYVGSRGIHLQENLVLNQLPEEALRLGNALRDQVPNPFFGQITTGPLANPTVSRAQLLRPYPHFDQVTAVNSTWGSSTYHGLLTRVEKRLSRGFNFIASYSFTKLIDDVGSVFGGETLGATGVQNFYDRRAERSISSLDIPHRLVFGYSYELPLGAGKRFITGGLASKLLGGWRLNGITTFQSGVPLGISTATNTTFAQGGGQRPNLLRDPRLPADERTVTRWFDTTAFGQPDPFTYGNAPRAMSGLRSDGENNTDFSIIKRTRIKERMNVEFRTEAFNIFNTPRFNPPNLAFGNPNFGTISAQANSPRIVQFGLKLAY